MTTLAIALLLSLGGQAGDIETADGFYCATDRYFAYETLLNESAATHLLHVVSLDDPSGTRNELTLAIPPDRARRIRCEPRRVTVTGEAAATRVHVDVQQWRATVQPSRSRVEGSGGGWQSTQLWGTGAWARSATQRITLRRYARGGRVALEVTRVSTGGAGCDARAGSRLVWFDGSNHERASRALVLRHLSCRRAGLDGGPVLDECSPLGNRFVRRFGGRVTADDGYSRPLPPFRVRLRAEGRFGWRIGVTPLNEDRDLTALIPLHGSSGRDIQPNEALETVALARLHPFTFHPDARRTIVYHDDALTMLVDDLRVASYGRGRLTIDRYSMSRDASGQPRFDWIEFSGCLSWPE